MQMVSGSSGADDAPLHYFDRTGFMLVSVFTHFGLALQEINYFGLLKVTKKAMQVSHPHNYSILGCS